MEPVTLRNHVGSMSATLNLALERVLETEALCIVSRLKSGEQMICILGENVEATSRLVADVELAKVRILEGLDSVSTLIVAGETI